MGFFLFQISKTEINFPRQAAILYIYSTSLCQPFSHTLFFKRIPMKKIYLLFFLLGSTLSLFYQKEMNNWIFGFGETVDFNTEPPTSDFLPDFSFFSENCTVSMSDETGDLLFYTDGNTIFNRMNQPMPNGFISSSFSATHPVFTIPKPGSPSSYYLLINIPGNISHLLTWIEIDLTLDGGLGDIVNPNPVFLSSSTGKTTAVLHQNLQDIWVISHTAGSSEFVSNLVTTNQVGSQSVSSFVGSVIPGNNNENGLGQIKTSINGNKIAVANQGLSNVEIFDFDRVTGVLSNAITIPGLPAAYGIEFSPSGRFLYVTHVDFSSVQPVIRQFDLLAGSPSQIINSGIIVGFSNGFEPGALQLAPNNQIYCNNVFDLSLGSIIFPDLLGTSSNFETIALSLSNESFRGLPSFFHTYLQSPNFNFSGICANSTTSFSIIEFEFPIDSVSWDFGDPASGVSNFSTSLSPTHNFSASGAYEVSLSIFANNQIFVSSSQVNIAPSSINLGADQTICANDFFVLDATVPNATYLWSNGSTQSRLEVEIPGTYWVEISVDTCTILTDTITLNYLETPQVDLGGNGGLCNGEEVMLDVTNPNASYLWSTGETSPSITIFFGGPYSVTVTNINGCSAVDQAFFSFDEVNVNPSQANLECFDGNDGIALVFPVTGQLPFTYLWDDGDTLYTNNDLTRGTHFVTVTDALGCTIVQEFFLTSPAQIEVNYNATPDNPNTLNPDGNVSLQTSGGTPPYTFEWEDFPGVNNPLLANLSNGLYMVTVVDDNDCEQQIGVEVGDFVSSTEEEKSVLDEINIFPNPVKEQLFIEITEAVGDDWEFSFFNILGQAVKEDYFLKKEKEVYSVNVEGWKSGIYFFKIRKEGVEKTWKFNVMK